MPISVVRLGSPRHQDEGLRLGTVRRPPRGVRKSEYRRRNYFDVWLPELAPSAPLFSWARSEPFTPERWKVYERRYRQEMSRAAAQRLIALLAALSSESNLSVGCYCADESHCHRGVLRELLLDAGATMVDPPRRRDNAPKAERNPERPPRRATPRIHRSLEPR